MKPVNYGCTNNGYCKKYALGCKRIVKRHHHKKIRQQGKKRIENWDEPHEVPIRDSAKYYYT